MGVFGLSCALFGQRMDANEWGETVGSRAGFMAQTYSAMRWTNSGLIGGFWQQRLYFLPLPQGQVALRPIFRLAGVRVLAANGRGFT